MRATALRAGAAASLAAVVALIGAGCAQAPMPPDLHYRLLLADGGAAAPGDAVLDGTLVVQRFRADGVLAQRPLAWVDAARPRALRQRNYHFWNAPPTEMLQDFTAERLRARGVAPRVMVAGSGVDADFTVSGRVRRLEQEVGEAAAVAVSLELALYGERPRRLLLLRRYDVREPLAAPAIDDAVAAINEALLAILDRFADELAAR